MSIVAFQDPPADASQRAGGNARYRLVSEQLKERPGEWALVDQDWWQALKNQIEAGTIVAFQPAGAFEAKHVREEGHKAGRAAIYARYVGTEGVNALPRLTTAAEALALVRELYEELLDDLAPDEGAARGFGESLRELEKRAS